MLQYSTVIGSSSTKIKDEKGDAGGFEERGENMNSHLGKGSIKKKRSNKCGTTVGSIKRVHCHYFKVRPVITVLLFFSSPTQLQDLTMATVLPRWTGEKELKFYARKWLWLTFDYKVKGENRNNGMKKSVLQHSIRVANKLFFPATIESSGFCNSVLLYLTDWLFTDSTFSNGLLYYIISQV